MKHNSMFELKSQMQPSIHNHFEKMCHYLSMDFSDAVWWRICVARFAINLPIVSTQQESHQNSEAPDALLGWRRQEMDKIAKIENVSLKQSVFKTKQHDKWQKPTEKLEHKDGDGWRAHGWQDQIFRCQSSWEMYTLHQLSFKLKTTHFAALWILYEPCVNACVP